ncbi:MAG: glycosyltransferase [Rubrivivax sp.]
MHSDPHLSADAAARSTRPAMVHVATYVTDEVFTFLGPATESMAARGRPQLVIAFDEPATRAVLARFGPNVELCRVSVHGSAVARWMRLRAALKVVLRERPQVAALHLHGFVSSALGMSARRGLGTCVPVYFSPHSSRVLGRLRVLARPAMALIGALGRGERPRPIANLGTDFSRLETITHAEVSLVESPVAACYFELPRAESKAPTIVAGSQMTPVDDEALDTFVRFVVLLRDTDAAPQFVWLGNASPEQRVRLKAANVRIIEPDDEAGRLRLLSMAWIYMAPAEGRGVPFGLAQAMAAGLACMAADTPFHRDVVEHLRTGVIYHTAAEALALIAQLLDSPDLRARLGAAARIEARRRFDAAGFAQRLDLAYRQPAAPSHSTARERQRGSVVNG